MKTLGLVLALTLVVGGASIAATEQASIDVYAGWNQIGCPLVPINKSVTEGDGLDYTEPYYAFGAVADDVAAGRLSRYDATTGSWFTYLTDESFGKLLLGDGYQLYASAGTTITYEGVPNGVPDSAGTKTDMWISLPGSKTDTVTASPNGGGWAMISTPYATDVPAYTLDGENVIWNINFTDGTTVKNWADAKEAGWVADTFSGFTNGSPTIVSYNDPDFYILKAGRGYWVKTYQDDIAMIITAPATAQ